MVKIKSTTPPRTNCQLLLMIKKILACTKYFSTIPTNRGGAQFQLSWWKKLFLRFFEIACFNRVKKIQLWNYFFITNLLNLDIIFYSIFLINFI